ncbi:hypothetical protein I5Q34_22400 [Streptomyces sp. AV19]|uniref:hypothetical protein n=1 Tax=Streptomyces sp. AV19 TaxID=2793068 RepID=UPI0018FEAE50|nr:hypothetical protein [Streptomyces sp. AV19]MBH1936985.1 hypothetical protein [Streptomyces sp. AV19]MDG4533039.1 hypothetical protein [Streptomyces sp. AV19]
MEQPAAQEELLSERLPGLGDGPARPASALGDPARGEPETPVSDGLDAVDIFRAFRAFGDEDDEPHIVRGID